MTRKVRFRLDLEQVAKNALEVKNSHIEGTPTDIVQVLSAFLIVHRDLIDLFEAAALLARHGHGMAQITDELPPGVED